MRPPTACEFCRSVYKHLLLRRYSLLPPIDIHVICSSRRRRCQRVPSDSAICTMCQKHSVPCIASAVTTNEPKSSHVRGTSFGIAARPTQANPVSNVVSASPHLDLASPHAVYLPQPSSHQGGATRPHTVDYGTTNDVVLPPAAVCFHLATLYFDYVHDQLHTLFQKPAFMTDMGMNKTPQAIMFAVVALSARSACYKPPQDIEHLLTLVQVLVSRILFRLKSPLERRTLCEEERKPLRSE